MAGFRGGPSQEHNTSCVTKINIATVFELRDRTDKQTDRPKCIFNRHTTLRERELQDTDSPNGTSWGKTEAKRHRSDRKTKKQIGAKVGYGGGGGINGRCKTDVWWIGFNESCRWHMLCHDGAQVTSLFRSTSWVPVGGKSSVCL